MWIDEFCLNYKGMIFLINKIWIYKINIFGFLSL
jgi:hypothetical protein